MLVNHHWYNIIPLYARRVFVNLRLAGSFNNFNMWVPLDRGLQEVNPHRNGFLRRCLGHHVRHVDLSLFTAASPMSLHETMVMLYECGCDNIQELRKLIEKYNYQNESGEWYMLNKDRFLTRCFINVIGILSCSLVDYKTFLTDTEYFHMTVTKLVIAGAINDILLLETISSFPNLTHFTIKTVRSALPDMLPHNNPIVHPHLRVMPQERFRNLTYLCLGVNYSWQRMWSVLERCLRIRCLRLGIFEEMGQLFYPFRPASNQHFLSNIPTRRNAIDNAQQQNRLQDVTQQLDNIFHHNQQLMYLGINNDNDDEATWEMYDREANSIPEQPQQQFVPGLRVFNVDQLIAANRVVHMQHVNQNTLTNFRCAMPLTNEMLLQDVTSVLLQNAINLTNLTSFELINITCSSAAIVEAITCCPHLQSIMIGKSRQQLDGAIIHAMTTRRQLRHATIIYPETRGMDFRPLHQFLLAAREQGILETFKVNRFNQNILNHLVHIPTLRNIHLTQSQPSRLVHQQLTHLVQGMINIRHQVQVLELPAFGRFFNPDFLAQVGQLPNLAVLDFCGNHIQNLNIFEYFL